MTHIFADAIREHMRVEGVRSADQVVGAARVWARAVTDRTDYLVCTCVDATHGPATVKRIADNVSVAVSLRDTIPGSHVVTSRHIHITCPKDVIA